MAKGLAAVNVLLSLCADTGGRRSNAIVRIAISTLYRASPLAKPLSALQSGRQRSPTKERGISTHLYKGRKGDEDVPIEILEASRSFMGYILIAYKSNLTGLRATSRYGMSGTLVPTWRCLE